MTNDDYDDNEYDFGSMTGKEICDFLNDSENSEFAVSTVWDYVKRQGTPYDSRWYALHINLWSLDSEVLAAIIRGFSDWDSNFEQDCLEELFSRAGVEIDDEESWGDQVYKVEEKLDISL